MLNLLKKIICTGLVTENYDKVISPERFRGELEINNDAKCTDCLLCQKLCPTGAITFEQGKLSIDYKACIFCGRCVEVCEKECISHSKNYELAFLAQQLQDNIKQKFGRSLHIRHLDVGSCNACDFEMAALNNPIYDVQQYGIDFVASPRHADMLMVTGTVTRNLFQALTMTYEAVPAPKLVMAVGACACSGKTFGTSYAIKGSVDNFIPVDIYVPGCPPKPQALIYGLLLAVNKL